MEKMKKTAKGLDTFFKIILLVVWVTGGLIIIAAAASCLMGGGDFTLVQSIALGNVSFELAPEFALDSGMIYCLAFVVLALVFIGLVSVWIKVIRNILKPMTKGLPFHDSIGGNLKKLGWLEIATGVVMNGMEFAQYLMIVRNFDLAELFASDAIVAVDVGYEFDVSFLITAAVFFLASYIFRYGAQLQQMSDETL